MTQTKPMDRYERIRRVASAFEREVSEYRDGTVELVEIASEPGVQTKVAVRSSDPNLDPVGACVGTDGERIRAVVAHLEGERIDIVPYDDEPVRFVCHALAPAWVKRVLLDEDNRQMELIIEDEQFAPALGADGVNLRLAAELTGWSLTLVTESQQEAAKALLREHLSAFDAELPDHLYHCGYPTIGRLARESPEQLADFAELPVKVALEIISAAKRASDSR